jgi:esterase
MNQWSTPKFVDLPNLQAAVYEYGSPSNPPLLLLHGGLSTGLSWHDVAVGLSVEWFILAPDSRGRGLSEHPLDGDYSTEAFVADAKALVDAYEFSKLAIGGHSEGGANATAFAATFPEQVTSLLVLENSHDLDFAAMAAAMPPGAIKIPIGTSFANWDEARIWQISHLPGVSSEVIERRLASRLVEKDGAIEWREDPRIFPYKAAHPQTADDRLDPIKKIQCRTQFLLATGSNLITDEAANIAVSNMPDASWKRIQNTGHNLHEDNLEDSLAEIREFLAGDQAMSS